MTPMEALVLQVVSCQSPDYLISSDASAFIAEGLINREEVDATLVSLQDQSFVEFFTEEETTQVVKLKRDDAGEPVLDENHNFTLEVDDDGNPTFEEVTTTVDAGWSATESGRSALENYGK